MTDSELDGLSAELKKAAKTTEQIRGTLAQLSNYKNTKNPEGIELFLKFKKISWLPTVLAAKDRQKIKQELMDFGRKHTDEKYDVFVRELASVFILKVEEAFK